MLNQSNIVLLTAAFLAACPAAFAQNGAVDLGTLQLNGNAIYNGKSVVLTNGLSQASSAFVPAPYTLQISGSFDVRFVYHATTIGGTPADGLAFVIQRTVEGPAYLGLGGAGLGFFTGTETRSVAVTFDYYYNVYTGTPANTIAIALPTELDIAQTPAPLQLVGGGAARYVRVTYNNLSSQMKVYVGDSPTLPATPTLQTTVPGLSEDLGASVYFGLTAGTGALESYQTLDYLAIDVVD